MPGSRLIGNARKAKARKAYNLHIKRRTNVEIAKELDIGRHLVATLINEEQEEVAQERDGTERLTA